jgi:DNA-binding CsgD family transcriptional regulator
MNSLTARLAQVLELGASGLTDKEIALRLGISHQTVESHWKKIRKHFAASSRTEVVARVAEQLKEKEVAALREELERLLFEIAERQRTEEQLRIANQRLQEALCAREEHIVRVIESRSQEYIRQANQEEPPAMPEPGHWQIQLESAIERSGIVVYQGEIDRGWRKLGATQNVSRFGFSAEDLVTSRVRIADRVPAEDLIRIQVELEAALAERAPKAVVAYRVAGADGSLRWMRDHMVFDYLPDGTPDQYFGIVVDIQDLKSEK